MQVFIIFSKGQSKAKHGKEANGHADEGKGGSKRYEKEQIVPYSHNVVSKSEHFGKVLARSMEKKGC